VEIIQQVREIKGVAGVHVMAYHQEELVAEIIEEAGLLPRPRQPQAPGKDPFKRDRKWKRKSGK
jgi:methylenetetrahydrofolate reductase (NADPH)